MNSDQSNDALMMQFFEALNSESGDGIRALSQNILSVAVTLEREQAIGSKPYERSEERKGFANGIQKQDFKQSAWCS